MTDHKAQKRRLEGAGFVYHGGWLPAANPVGKRFDDQVAMFAEDVAAIKAGESGPRGWPKGKPRKASA
jgi:hypothetical protein